MDLRESNLTISEPVLLLFLPFNVRMFTIDCRVNQSEHKEDMGHLIFKHNLVCIQTSNWTAFHYATEIDTVKRESTFDWIVNLDMSTQRLDHCYWYQSSFAVIMLIFTLLC